MKRSSPKSLITVAAVLLLALAFFGGSAPAIAQGVLQTFFGPEEFLRSKGKPIVEDLQFSTTGYEPPFILHLRNGDENGEHRVSSAWVWLNDQLALGPSDFNQQVTSYDFEVTLTDPSIIEVKAAGEPGGKLTLWIEGTNPNLRTVTPAGGIFEFPNGVILEIPVGAVTEAVDLEITDASCEEVDAILSVRELVTHKKRCLHVFSGKPDGLTFETEITARVPVPPLTPDWTPLQVKVDLDEKTYWIVPGEMTYWQDEDILEMKLVEFSESAAAEGQSVGEEPEAVCRTCEGFENNKENCKSLSDIYDPYQDPCCLIKLVERPNCYPVCDCCKEREMNVTVEAADFQSGDCSIVGTERHTEYPQCPPGANFDEPLFEQTPACPEGMYFAVEIVSDRDSIYRCETAQLTAQVSGQKGNVSFTAAAFPAKFEITSGSNVVADAGKIEPNGNQYQGVSPGTAVIRARPIGKDCGQGEGEINCGLYALQVEELELDIHPGGDFFLPIGASRELWHLCFACPQPVEWSTDNPALVTVTDLGGGAARVTANNPTTTMGPRAANIFARSYNHCGESIGDVLTVTVPAGPGYTITWNATISGGAQWSMEGQNVSTYWSESVVGSWDGIATIGYDGTVRGFGTGGYYNDYYIAISQRHDCEAGLTHIQNMTWTLTDAGAEAIKNSLHIVVGQRPNGFPYVADPFAWARGPGATGLGATLAWITDTTGWPCCPIPSEDPPACEYVDDHTGQEIDSNFPSFFSPGDIEANNQSGSSFSGGSSEIIGYLGVGASQQPIYVNWTVDIIRVQE